MVKSCDRYDWAAINCKSKCIYYIKICRNLSRRGERDLQLKLGLSPPRKGVIINGCIQTAVQVMCINTLSGWYGSRHISHNPHATSSIFYEHTLTNVNSRFMLIWRLGDDREGWRVCCIPMQLFGRRKLCTYYSTLDVQQCTIHWGFVS